MSSKPDAEGGQHILTPERLMSAAAASSMYIPVNPPLRATLEAIFDDAGRRLPEGEAGDRKERGGDPRLREARCELVDLVPGRRDLLGRERGARGHRQLRGVEELTRGHHFRSTSFRLETRPPLRSTAK